MVIVEYKMEFQNSTNTGYYFVVYQEYEGSARIAWMTVGVPHAQSVPSTGHVEWKMKYGVTVVEEESVDSSYHIGSVTLFAEIGQKYEVVLVDKLPQVKDVGVGAPDYIEIHNFTDLELNLGLTLSGNLVATQQTAGGATAVFKVNSTYHVGVFRTQPTNEFHPSTSSLPPITVNFPTGMNVATLGTGVKNGEQVITNPQFSYESNPEL